MVAVEAYISERFLTRKNGVRGYVEVASKKKRNGQKPVFKPVTRLLGELALAESPEGRPLLLA